MTVAAPQAASPNRAWLATLGATLLIQTTLSFLSRLVPTLAPVLTAASGLTPDAVGYLAAAGTAGSILFLAAGNPIIARLGPIRALQVGLGVGIGGVLLLVVPSALVQFGSSFLAGLAYGPSAPAGSDILLRLSPPHRRTLIFSLKQAGVPLGGMLSGITLPALVEMLGLSWSMALVALIPLATILASQCVRHRIDTARDRAQSIAIARLLSPANMLEPLRVLGSSPVLPRLTLAGAFLACGQGSLFAFLVTYLNQGLGLDLVTSGGIYAITQVAGIPGRIALGWIADRMGSGLPALRFLSVTSAVTSAVYAMTTSEWSLLALTVLAGVAGITVSSWNGVQLAEVARAAPKGRVGETTSGATLYVFFGYIVGPALFATLVAATGGYRVAFFLTAVLTLTAALVLWPKRRG